ncbi:hypothetical protein IB49_05780 [Geobacillus sp. LC300]|nr:hypothetical protein IB49_05780 [Geobacillus sp. LC300]
MAVALLPRRSGAKKTAWRRARFFTNSQKQGAGAGAEKQKKTAASFRLGCRFWTTSIFLGEWFTTAPAA